MKPDIFVLRKQYVNGGFKKKRIKKERKGKITVVIFMLYIYEGGVKIVNNAEKMWETLY